MLDAIFYLFAIFFAVIATLSAAVILYKGAKALIAFFREGTEL
jgi:hypothetical protein